ncbi:MAG: protein translocase subunit SecF [Candidatus Cloacimonetes bacterium]|nr:protein translocase subunit SecF [Candidatus Cloacimonadota bacterium]
MRFFGETSIDFVSKRRIAFILSTIVILVGIVSMFFHEDGFGPALSIDFTGGVLLELDLSPMQQDIAPLTVEQVRDALTLAGFADAEILSMEDTGSGKTYFQIKSKDSENGNDIMEALQLALPNHYHPEPRSQEKVGPKVGSELKGKAILAIFWAMFFIILYIWWRFQFTFGVAAVAALLHDVLITVGIFSLTGKEVSLAVVAALLTIVGYSLNDTIVVFDRIREDLKVYRRESYESVINHSINETLSRTVITSLTTFLVVLSLYIFGGPVIHDFSFALLIGIAVGTYSSIFIASPILVEYFTRRERRKGIKRGH